MITLPNGLATPYGVTCSVYVWDGNATINNAGMLNILLHGYVSADSFLRGSQPLPGMDTNVSIPAGIYNTEQDIEAQVVLQQGAIFGGIVS